MTKLFYTILTTLFFINSGYTSNITDLHQRITSTLSNLHTTEELYFNKTQELCSLLNINENQHYVFEFIRDVYNTKQKIESINDLYCFAIRIYLNDINNKYNNIYKILMHNNIKIIENINTIFDTRRKIDNLRKELCNLETEKVEQKSKQKPIKNSKL